MRQAASSQNAGTPQSEAEARRAAERLQEAQNLLRGMQQQQNDGTVEQLAQKAENLARQQEDFSKRLRRSVGSSALGGQEGAAGDSATRRDGVRVRSNWRRKKRVSWARRSKWSATCSEQCATRRGAAGCFQ